MMGIEAEVREIKLHVIEISEKIDELMYEKEIPAMMKLAEKSLSGFFEAESDIYLGEFDEELRQEVNQKLKKIMEI